MFSHMGIGSRLAAGFAVILVLFLIAVGFGIWRLSSVADSTRRMMDVPLAKERMISDWSINVNSGVRRTAATAKSSDPSLASYFAEETKTATEQSAGLQKKIGDMLEGDEEKALFEAVGEMRNKYLKSRNDIIQMKHDGKLQEAEQMMTDVFTPTAKEYLARIQKLLEYQRHRIDVLSEQVQSDYRFGRTLLIVFGIVAAALAVWLAWAIQRSITSPLRELEGTIGVIAQSGDLTQRVSIRTQDEIGMVAASFNTMIDRVHVLAKQVTTSANQVSSVVGQMTETAGGLQTSSEQQSNSLNASAAAIEELSVSIATVADTVVTVQGLSVQSVANTNEGNTKVTELVGEIYKIRATVADTAAAIEEFVRSTKAITAMIEQVRNIADQTNLLALNAAIEAARAGEQGRGFAVVADEVRKLAEMSGSSASEINDLAQTIIQHSEHVSVAIDNGRRSVEMSTELAGAVENTLNQARASVEQSSGGVDEITRSVQEQRTASTEIAQNVQEITVSANMANDAAQMLGRSATQLNVAVSELESAVSGFRV